MARPIIMKTSYDKGGWVVITYKEDKHVKRIVTRT